MTVHQFTPTRYYTTLGTHEPALTVKPGDSIITTTTDSGGTDHNGVKVTVGPNPMTGPFYVEGAEPGDTLVMHLDRLTPNRPTGFANSIIAANAVEPDDVVNLPWDQRERIFWNVDPVGGTASLVEPLGKLGNFTLPIVPMLGCFGVAAPYGQAISTATSAEHGGNMDYRGFVAGVTVYFPVFAPGALVFLGDGHALQGDGEMSGTGIEIPFEVQFTVDVQKKTIGWPRGENADYIFTVGNARPLDQAVQHATSEMLRWLQTDYGLSAREANVLLGYCVEYDLGNMYDPAYTMVCKIPKRRLP